ncbi:MAG: hypothetical protein ACJAVY_001817 [Marinoscillum sp.]|jgi:hypothetical protein
MKSILGAFLLLTLVFTAHSQDDSKPKQPDLPGELSIDFGFNFWNQKPDLLPTRMWSSNSLGIYYAQRVRFNDYFSFVPAVGFTFEKYGFESNFSWMNNSNGVPALDTLTGNIPLTKNKLVVNYFDIPLEFRIHPFGTVDGEGFFIALGGVAGMRMGAHTKIKYDLNDNSVKEKLYDDFGINRFRYGLQARLGAKSFHIFYKMYLNEVFKSAPEASGINPTPFTIGLNFSGF